MCKRQAGVKLNDDEKGLEGLVDDVTEDHAKLILDRLELLSKAREIIKHPKLEENIKLCENNLDTPDWWISGKHDRELLRAVLKHGIYRSEQLILADPEFPFYEAAKKYLQNLEIQIQLQNQQLMKMQAAKAEASEKAELAMKLEKGDGSLKIEKVPIKKETENAQDKDGEQSEVEPKAEVKVEDEVKKEQEEAGAQSEKPIEACQDLKEDVKEEKSDEKSSQVEDNKMEVDGKTAQDKDSEEKEDGDVDKEEETKSKEEKSEAMEVDAEEKAKDESVTEKDDETKDEQGEDKEKSEETEEKSGEVDAAEQSVKTEEESPAKKGDDSETAKKSDADRESSPDVIILDEQKADVKPNVLSDEEKCSKQAADLKARFPDLEVFQPLMKLKQLDNSVSKEDFKSKFTVQWIIIEGKT